MKAKEFITEQETGIVDAVRDFLPIAIKTLKLKQLPKITFLRMLKANTINLLLVFIITTKNTN